MSRSAIRDLVQNTVNEVADSEGFRPYVTPVYLQAVAQVVDSLCENLDILVDTTLATLREEATNLGARAEQVDRIFTAAGLDHDPEPVADEPQADEPQADEPGDVDQVGTLQARLNALEERVNNALASAQRQGYRL